MSGQLAEVAARLDSTRQLGSVISAMRAIAASRSQQARRELEAIRLYAATIGQAIDQVLGTLPAGQSMAPPAARSDGVLVVALCAEQGFAGSFNERVLDVALPLADDGHLFVVGDRGLMVAGNRGRTPDWSVPMAAHTDEVSALADRISDAVYAALAARGTADRVLLVYGSPAEGEEPAIVRRWLLPFDFGRFPARLAVGQVPLMNLPPAVLLEQLAVEYVHADLCEALMLSYAAENQARMQAMIAAHGNLERTEATLTLEFQRVRQEDITDEILELSAART
ncbi:MAG: H(+)-transporting ATPase [Lysobacterales bacterium 14-68-21]|jgi:F-type H+-transporting ATPase subunit gamma|nr:MAG: H(+)-transporting ATPase [Xanthomonadales bacterium 15-68-25]OZB63439.1 MAG: H(+)-transporting ATPase [Xanthomonadales bacterium 14-68-21]